MMTNKEKSLEELFEEQIVTDEDLAEVEGGAELIRAVRFDSEDVLSARLDRASLVERIESIDLSRFFDRGLGGGGGWVFRPGERDVGH